MNFAREIRGFFLRLFGAIRAFDSWWLDVKLGVRMLVKYPGLALAGGFGIAVGVAIAAGAYSVIYGNYMASSLPLAESERLVSIEVWDSAASKPARRILRDYRLWREELRSVPEIGAFQTITPNLILPGSPPESVRVASMSASGFRIARVRPLIGRYLEEQDEREGSPMMAVIGESVWRNRFAGDPAILERTLQLGSTSYAIAGVMPEAFAFPVNHRIWVPLRAGLPLAEPLTGPEVMVFGRLAAGATLANAQAELATIGGRTAAEFPERYAQLQPRMMPYPNPFMGLHETSDVSGLHMMQGVVTLLLILVCLNVAILVYSRTATRHAEIAVRTALGASRGRIVAQLFMEALVLSAVAALAGVGIAAFSLRLVATATMPLLSELPFWLTFQLVPGSLLYAGLLSVLAAAIVGIAPALKATKRDVQSGLRVIGTGGSGMRLGTTWTVLIVAQVAVVVAVLPTAASSAWGDTMDSIAGLGFPAEEYLSAQLGMDAAPGRDVTSATVAHELIGRLEAEPQVAGVTFAMFNPGNEKGSQVEIEGVSGSSQPTVQGIRFNRVDAHFFQTFGVPILAGRGFAAADIGSGQGEGLEGSAVVVNQSLAQQVFGGNALGRRFRYAGSRKGEQPGRWYEVVGIVSDFPTGVSQGMRDSAAKAYHAAAAGQLEPSSIAIRMHSGSPVAFTRRLQEIAAAVHPDLHLRQIRGLDEVLRSEQWISRLQAAVVMSVTLSVLLLSAAGIYALMSFTVAQRRKEIGIRMALGADRRRIVAGIFSRALGQLGVGAALGAVAAAGMENQLGLLRKGNAAVIVPFVAVLMIAVGVLAAVGPARRSLRIEPTEALREH